MQTGHNCKIWVEGRTLMVAVDLDDSGVFSRSGKSRLIGSSLGPFNLAIEGTVDHSEGIHVALNVYRKLTAAEKAEWERQQTEDL